jgi:DNA-binding response OmpR family regulator
MPRILVIAKDYDLSTDAAAAFAELGYEVLKTRDADEGLAKLRESNINLVIGDADCSADTGAELCSKIRQASYIPIIIVGEKEAAAETLDIGADAYLAKPPYMLELVARVKRLLRFY